MRRSAWTGVLTGALAATSLSFVTPAAFAADVSIQVDVQAKRRPIDPRIYGMCFADATQLSDLRATLNRRGGNTTTRYNWELDADNKGADWYFESIAISDPLTPGGDADAFISATKTGGAEPLITIPLIGWLANVGPSRGKLASFSQATYGAQTDADWSWMPDAGNGILAATGAYVVNDPTDASVQKTSATQKAWVQHLVSKWGAAGSGGVRYYLMDNESAIWFSTHRDVHPVGPKMEEIRDLIFDYGTRVKEADPNALVVGPEEWGWSNYFYSGYDSQYAGSHGWSSFPDRDAHAGWDYLPWLLDQMRQREVQTGKRLLDVFTVHCYPQSGEVGTDTSTATQLLRNRSTRSLWDPSYVDESWIGDIVQLIPRLRGWVNTYYPNTLIGITEYNWGAESHINGATTQADILGIFGREGLDLATRWTTPDASTPTYKAIKMYRNYDGSGGTFGDVSVSASGPNPDQVSVFAAQRSSDGAVTVMVINKVIGTSQNVTLNLANVTPSGAAQAWQLTSANAITRLADVPITSNHVVTTVPAQSITLFVVPSNSGPTLSVGDVQVAEGSSATNAIFTVTLSAAASQAVTVSYATANGTATAGSDYTAVSGTLTFSPGATAKTISVPVIGDTTYELDETFFLNLSTPVNATISRAQATGTIVNDDVPSQTLSINDVSVVEGNSGTTAALFTVTLSTASSLPVTANYATANGSATAGSDYVAQAGNLSFSPGQTTKTISVMVNGDTAVESNETFTVTLSGVVGATLARAQGTGTITNDDVAPTPTPTPGGVTTEQVVWTAVSGVTVSGSNLTKTAVTAWGNAGAISTRSIASGDGYVEFLIAETNTARMVGLSRGDTDKNYTDIDFAAYPHSTGVLMVYEGGTARGSFGAYATGDHIRVSVTAGVVRYSKNGVVFYTSTQAPTYPLLVDTALLTTGATIQGAVISGNLTGGSPTPTPTPTPTATPTPTPTPTDPGTPPPLGVSLPLFPATNWWNQDVSQAPLDTSSASFISFIGGTRSLHPDFGGYEDPGPPPSQTGYGIPYVVVNGNSRPKRAVVFDLYGDESDGVDHNTGKSLPFYPIPDEAITQPYMIEGGQPGNQQIDEDRHMLIVDKDNNYLYELGNVYWDGTQWHAGAGAFFDMNTNNRRPDGWTSSDAAGLAILPGLVRYDEVFGPDPIRHALRVTVRSTNGYVYPASHQAGSTTGAPPMGMRLRLKASVDITVLTSDVNVRKIFQAMKTYGLIVADNGSDMFISGTFDPRWNNDVLNPAFGNLTASSFEVVQRGWTP